MKLQDPIYDKTWKAYKVSTMFEDLLNPLRERKCANTLSFHADLDSYTHEDQTFDWDQPHIFKYHLKETHVYGDIIYLWDPSYITCVVHAFVHTMNDMNEV